MAIAFGDKTQGPAGSSPHSYSHTVSGSNAILYVHIFLGGGAQTISAMTYNSVAMTLVDSQISGTGGTAFLYRLVNPTTGSNTVAITFSASFGTSVATFYTGAKQSGGVFVTGKNQGATTSVVTLTPNSANNWIAFAVGADVSAPTATNSAFLRQVGSNVAITAFDTNGGVTGSTTVGATSDSRLYGVAESFEPAVVSVKSGFFNFM
jgi:hypothetical protein